MSKKDREWTLATIKAGIVLTMGIDHDKMTDEQLVIKALIIELAKAKWSFFWKSELHMLQTELALAKFHKEHEELQAELEKAIKNSDTLLNKLKDIKPNE